MARDEQGPRPGYGRPAFHRPDGRGGPSRRGEPGSGDRFGSERPRPSAPAPFARPPLRGGDLATPPHSVRLRDGEREVEVTGSAAFIRQLLDDLPALLGRLQGSLPAGSRGGPTAMPSPRPPSADIPVPPASSGGEPDTLGAGPQVAAAPRASSPAALEDSVLAILRSTTRPLTIAAIRERLDEEVSGQTVRRLLERAAPRVQVSSERPATYALRGA